MSARACRRSATAPRPGKAMVVCVTAMPVLIGGCQSVPSTARSGRTVGSAVGEATGTVIGRQYGESAMGRSVGSKLGSVAGEMAGSAVVTPGSQPANHPQAAPERKFCPVGGEVYPGSFRFCPLHGAELRDRSPSLDR